MVKEEIERQIRQCESEKVELVRAVASLDGQVNEARAAQRRFSAKANEFERMVLFRKDRVAQIQRMRDSDKLAKSVNSRLGNAVFGNGLSRVRDDLDNVMTRLTSGIQSTEESVREKRQRIAWLEARIGELRAQLAFLASQGGGAA